MAEPLRVLLVDDHPMFREGVRFTLERAGLAVVGEAADGEGALRLVGRLAPDVVVMDLAMPGMGGLAATAELVAGGSQAAVLVLTMSAEDSAVLAALQAGARGYLVKGVGPDEVVAAVRGVAAGHAVLGPELAGRLLELFTPPAVGGLQPGPGAAIPEGAAAPRLSPREREVLELVARGLSNQQIAERLFLSPITVRNHVSHILTKLQLADRRQVMLRFAPRNGPA